MNSLLLIIFFNEVCSKIQVSVKTDIMILRINSPVIRNDFQYQESSAVFTKRSSAPKFPDLSTTIGLDFSSGKQ